MEERLLRTTRASGDTPSKSGLQLYKTFDDVIIKVAEGISGDSDLRKLLLELGVKTPDIDQALKTNLAADVKTRHGNQMMLQNWAKTVKPFERLPTLRAALKKAGLGKLEETCLPSTLPPETIYSVRNDLMNRRHLEISDDESTAAYFIALETLGKDAMRKGSVVGETLGIKKAIDASTSSSHAATSSLSIGKKLQSSVIEDEDLPGYMYLYKSASAIRASQSKARKGSVIDETLGIGKTTDTSMSSSHLAAIGLFTLQNLQSLAIMDVDLDDDFYKGMCAASSQSKIDRFMHAMRDTAPLGPDASLHYARGLFSMPNLQSLDLYQVKLSDEFYSSMATEASKSKIERFTHYMSYTAPLGPDASLHYARGLFSMPNLQSLDLTGLELSDEFYSCMATEASKSKIEEFRHRMFYMASLGPDASFHYARGLFSMPNLRSLDLTGLELSDEFCSCMATEASKSKIEEFRHRMFAMAPLGPDASLHYARGLFSMPNLRSLALTGLKLSDEFYSCMATEVSKSKIDRFTHDMRDTAPLGPDASLHYARCLFSMPNLQSLNLTGLELSDEFHSSMATEVQKSKVQRLVLENVSMTRRILDTFLSLTCLQSLTLRGIHNVDKNDKEMLTSQSISVKELSVDCMDVTALWKLGLHTSCTRVQKLMLNGTYKGNVSSEIVTMAGSPFHHLTHLLISGHLGTLDSESFSSAVITSCPQLTKLSLDHIDLHNEQATEIIQSMKTHPHLLSIDLSYCETDMGLDPLIAKVNGEDKLTVNVKHDWVSEQRKKMLSVTEKKTPPSLQASASDDLIGATTEMRIREDETDTQGKEKEEEEKGEEEEEEDQDQYGARESFHHETVSDENKTRPIEMECRKTVGVEGNKLRLDSFGIELEIPPGAIDSETPQDISFRVLTDTPNLSNSKEEMSVCFGVQCLAPDDLVLKLPVTYTIPHCAVITRYSDVETILYMGEGEYTPDSDIKERILLTKSGIPNCTIKKEVLQLQMNHFSWAYIRFKMKNFFFRGKRMRCWPFAEKELPAERTPVILRAHLYDDIKGNKEIISQEEYGGYGPVHPETEVLIKMAEVDVYMTCLIESREIVKPAIVHYDDLCRGHHRIRSFNLDLTRELDVVVVTLQVGQERQYPEELLCKFSFKTLSRSTSLPPHDQEELEGASSSQISQISHGTEEENPELSWCQTDMGLDPLIAEVNREGKLTVTVLPEQVSQQSKDMPSVTAKKTSPSLHMSSSDDLVGATAGIQSHEDETEEEDEEEKKEVEEDYYSATENFPYETVPDENNIPPMEMECHKSVGVQGDKLQLDSFGIELEIPPGAIDRKMLQDISLRVLTDTPNLGDTCSKEEVSVCFGVQCSAPDGMVLKSPVTFTIPHCAIISRPYDIKAVLYCGEGEYTPGAVVKERTELPLSGTPSCIIMKDVLKFRVNHFSWWFFTFSKNYSLQGKRLCCLPMVCTKMPVERTPVILHTHLYDDIKGNREYGIFNWIKSFFAPEETWLEEELNEAFRKVHSETQILVEPPGEDLKLTCSVNEETGQEKSLSYNKICSLSHNCVPFQLDLRDHSDNVAVLLKVGQKDETELLCPVQFTPDKGSRSALKESKVDEAEPAGQNDFDEILKIVAKKVVNDDEIDDLGKALDFNAEDIHGYIATNMRDQNKSCMGTLSMLRKWRKKQTESKERDALEDALKNAGQIYLADKLFGSK